MSHSRLASPSATIAVLQRYGLYTRKALGQHFLVDDNVIGRILEHADIRPGDIVLEVGPGIGTLTWALLEAGARVVAVEYDERLLLPLADIAESHPSLSVLHADAVSVPVEKLVATGQPRALVANLPYGVAATVILRFFDEIPSLERAVVMVQAEVADRIAANTGTKAYGAYTVKLGMLTRVTARFAVSRSCFMPPPRVDSAVIRLDRVAIGATPEVLKAAARVADAAFSQRRKILKNSLAAGLGLPVSEVEQILREASVDPSRRAEDLAVAEYLSLGALLREY